MLPHHGQDANTSIEDAVTLAELLPHTAPGELTAMMARYEMLRRPRTRIIQRAAWAANRALHLPDGAGLSARDAMIARFAKRFGWIHAFDARAAVGGVPVAERYSGLAKLGDHANSSQMSVSLVSASDICGLAVGQKLLTNASGC
jgi:salicylate hydroxylase